MKNALLKKLLVLPLLFMAGIIIAQPPPGLPYQAVAKDPLGNAAKNRKIFVKDIIVQKTPSGNKVWEESFEVQSDNDGIYTIVIGQGKVSPSIPLLNIGQIDWGNGPFFVNTKIAIAPSIPAAWWIAADNYIDLGTTQMMSVPYALFAGNASVTNVNTSIQAGPKNTFLVTNVNTSIQAGPKNTFLVTDSLGNVNWALPQAANQTVTTVSNFNLNLNVSNGQNINIPPNTTAVVTVRVFGVKIGDPAIVSAQGDYKEWAIYSSWVSKDDEVSIRFANYTNIPVDVKGSQYKIVVIK